METTVTEKVAAHIPVKIREKLPLVPKKPGVYLMLDAKGSVLYIGKAKSLRSRIASYFQRGGMGDGRIQIPRMIMDTSDFDYIVTDSDKEALVIEANLVREKKPKYNINLKDDKSYPYLKLTSEPFPRIFVTRTVKRDGGRYFGPYTDVKALRRTLGMVQKLFPLRRCKWDL